MATTAQRITSPAEVSHNLVGQRLGRKGLETRERVIAAMMRLLEDPDGQPITLTAVAREASLGMTTLYLYFPDMGVLLLAVLDRVMATADVAYLDLIRDRWPDDAVAARSLLFLQAHLRFWTRHARLLHLRNGFADSCDLRVLERRSRDSRPLLELLMRQMDCVEEELGVEPSCAHAATVMLIGLERVATVVTNPHFHLTWREQEPASEAEYVEHLLVAEARVLELTIRDRRSLSALR